MARFRSKFTEPMALSYGFYTRKVVEPDEVFQVDDAAAPAYECQPERYERLDDAVSAAIFDEPDPEPESDPEPAPVAAATTPEVSL